MKKRDSSLKHLPFIGNTAMKIQEIQLNGDLAIYSDNLKHTW